MKKLLKSALLFAVGSTASLQALPVGNPAEPSLLIDGTMWEGTSGDPCDPCATWCDAISIRAGFYGDYVFDRVLKTDVTKTVDDMAAALTIGTTSNVSSAATAATRDNAAYGKHIHDAEWATNAAYLALNIWDRFDVFCTLGASSGYFKAGSDAFSVVGLFGINQETLAGDRPNVFLTQGVVELYTDTSFSWSIGARGALWECGCATLGAEFQYAQSKPKVETLNVLCTPAQFTVHKPRGYKNTPFPLPEGAGTDGATDTKSATIQYHEWQAGLALSYRLNMLVPYLGVKWSRASFDADNIRIAQPKLAKETLYLTAWNPTFMGSGTAGSGTATGKLADFIQIASMEINKMKSRKACGVVVGATLVDADKWSITGEARLIDERAAHVNAQFRF